MAPRIPTPFRIDLYELGLFDGPLENRHVDIEVQMRNGYVQIDTPDSTRWCLDVDLDQNKLLRARKRTDEGPERWTEFPSWIRPTLQWLGVL